MPLDMNKALSLLLFSFFVATTIAIGLSFKDEITVPISDQRSDKEIGIEISSDKFLGHTIIEVHHNSQLINGKPSINKIVEIHPENDEDLNANLVFEYDDDDLSTLDNKGEELILYSSVDDGKTWQAHPNTIHDKDNNSFRLSEIEHFSIWTVASVDAIMVDSSTIITYDQFLANLDGTINSPDPTLEFTASFPYCNSINTYPSPFTAAEFSNLPFGTFCPDNVQNNITNRGTDSSYQVIVGGDFTVPATGGSEIEGRLAIGGDLLVDKAPAPFRVGETNSGTAIVSEPGVFLIVRGQADGAGRINTGASEFGIYTAEIGGTSSLTINGASQQTSTSSFSYDIDTLLTQTKSMSELMRDMPITGTLTGGFQGTNSALEIFNITAADLAGAGTLPFIDIDPSATIIINVNGTTVNYEKSIYNGRINDPTAILNGSDIDATVFNVVWNFYNATDVTINSTTAGGIQGLVLIPDGNVDFRSNFNGRMIVGGNMEVNGSGAEFHNYPFKGDLSDVIASNPPRACVLATDDNSVTPINTAVTINQITNDTIEDISTTSIVIPVSGEPQNGTFILNVDRSITYTPNIGFQGLDSLQYIICDTASENSNCDTAFIRILVGLEAFDDSFIAQTDTPLLINPLDNDIINPFSTILDTSSINSTFKGTLVLNNDGSAVYTSPLGFSGRDTISFIVCDTNVSPSVCDTSLAVFGVLSVIPIVVDDNSATTINTNVNIEVLKNDTYSDTTLLSIRILDSTSNGTLTINADFSIDFSPINSFTGLDTFRYEICDTTIIPGVCDSGLVIITVDPEAVSDTFLVTTEEATIVTPFENDTINPLVTKIDTTLVGGPKNGDLTILPDGSMSYVSDPGFFGTDTVIYQICDTSVALEICDTALILFQVLPIAPDAIDDVTATKINEDVTIDVEINDIIIDALKTGIISSSVVTSSSANVIINPDATITYTPFLDFRGLDTLNYVLCDTSTSTSVCDTAQILVMVGPLALDDSTITSESISVSVLPLVNDTVHLPYTKFDTTLAGGPDNGTLAINTSTGQVEYTPNVNFIGRDTVEFVVCDTSVVPNICDTSILTIRVFPAPPLASNDTIEVFKNQKTSYDILDNDIIPNPDPTKYTITVISTNGTLIKESDTTLAYTPQLDFIGSDSARYVLCDTSLIPAICDTAWVFFNVIEKPSPMAVDDVSATPLDTDVNINIISNDIFPDPTNTTIISVTSITTHGALVLLQPDGSVTYSPNTSFKGFDTLQYIVCDTFVEPDLCDSALVVITVSPDAVDDSVTVNQGDTLVINPLDNDTINTTVTTIDTTSDGGPDNGMVVINPDNTIDFIPDSGFMGTDTITLVICDTSVSPPVCDTSIIIVNVLPNPPDAINDSLLTRVNQEVTILVLDNDILYNPNNTELSLITTVSNGTVQLIGDTSFQYTPALDFIGSDSLQYAICDTSLTPDGCDTAWVFITVEIKSAPNAINDVRATLLDSNITINVLENDIIPDTLHTIITELKTITSSGASAIIGNDGNITYSPFTGYRGLDTLSYTICDTIVNPNLCDSAFIIISVGPFAMNDTLNTVSGDTSFIDIRLNDSFNSTVTTIDTTADGGPKNGILTFTTDGRIQFIPNIGYEGNDTATFVLCDTSVFPSICDTSLLFIIAPPEDFTAINDSIGLRPNIITNLLVLNNDEISTLDHLSLSILDHTVNGSINLISKDSIIYTPNLDFQGVDSLSYIICDTVLIPELCDTAMVYLTISEFINNPPFLNPDTLFIFEDSSGTINLLANDFDADLNSMVLTNVSLLDTVTNGALNFDSTGHVLFVPDSNYFGEINYEYTVTDSLGATNQASFIIIVEPVNDPPIIIVADSLEPEELFVINTGNIAKSPNILLNNLDPENDMIFIQNIVSSNSDFTGYTLSDSTISYIPFTNFVGTDTVVYTVCDNGVPMECIFDTLFVYVTAKNDSNLFVPKGFSPNNDGINDYFEIVGLDNFDSNSIKVFNRWGITVFQEDNYENTWNGTNNVSLSGRVLPSAGYLYVLTLTRDDGTEIIKKGSIFINR